MRIRDLGPIEVEIEGRTDRPRGAKPATLLCALTLNANRRVPIDTLIDAMWGDHVTSGRASTLDSHIFRLRNTLEPGRARGAPPAVLLNDAAGYRLLVDLDDLDSAVFERLVDEGRTAMSGGHPERALRRWDAALALWRGRPYSPCTDQPWALPTVTRLDEIAEQVRELRIDVLIELGRYLEAMASLESLTEPRQVRERRYAQRIQTLIGIGDIVQASAVYDQASARLLDELGVDPGTELQTLRLQLIDASPRAETRAAFTGGQASADRRPAGEPRVAGASRPGGVGGPPRRLTPIVGRQEELARLSELTPQTPLLSIVGPAGVGKTRLAVELMRALTDEYPDGLFLVNLATIEHADLVVDVTLSTLGVTPAEGTTPIRALASHLAARQVLIMLDNCEHLLPEVSEIVHQLLDPEMAATVVATSREPLGLAGEMIYTVRPLPVPDADGDAAAAQLLRARLHAADPTLVLTESDHASIAQICAALDGLPLALELAAARARAFSVAEIADQVTEDPARLSGPRRVERDSKPRSLDDEIDRSYRQVTELEQRAHRAISVLPGAFTVEAAGAVLDQLVDSPPRELLPLLVNRSLLTATRPVGRGSTTFSQLATVRAHASARLDEAQRAGLRDARDAWVYSLFDNFRMGADEQSLYRLVDDNLSTVRATLERGLTTDFDHRAALLAARLSQYWYTRLKIAEAPRWESLAVAQAGGLAPAEQALVRSAYAGSLVFRDRTDLARQQTSIVADLLVETPVVYLGQALTVAASAAVSAGEPAYAAECLALAARVCAACNDPGLNAQYQAAAWLLRPPRDEHVQAVVSEAQELLTAVENAGLIFADVWISVSVARSALHVGDTEVGVEWSRRAVLASADYTAHPSAASLNLHASLLARSGDRLGALTVFAASSAHARRMGHRWPRSPDVEQELRDLRGELPADAYDNAWTAGATLDTAALRAVVAV